MEDKALESIRTILNYIGDDANREGLLDTPKRVVKSYKHLFSGYSANVEEVFTVFNEYCDEIVLMKNIEFASTCEHHMLPFLGKAHIAYLPDGNVIGASKLVRVLEVYARRLQIQERIGQQVTAALDHYLRPKGSACILEAKHLCMVCRGVEKQGSTMVTSSLTGIFRDERPRSELLSLL